MKRKSMVKTTILDERQKQFVLKAYQCGYWFMIFILWLSVFTNRWFSELISPDFMSFLALVGGVAISMTIAILNDSHPFVDQRLNKYGKYFGFPILVYGLFMALSTMVASVNLKIGWSEFFAGGGTGSMLILSIGLISMGGATVYRNYKNMTKEVDD